VRSMIAIAFDNSSRAAVSAAAWKSGRMSTPSAEMPSRRISMVASCARSTRSRSSWLSP
jgi:hypothetical protein